MKKLFLFISFLSVFVGTKAQQWDWAEHLPGYAKAHMDEDSLGNIYTVVCLSSSPIVSQFQKMDSLGNQIWSKTLNCVIRDIKVGNNNVLITGSFQGSVMFGTTSLNSAGFINGFLADYDPSGNLKWVKQSAGSGNIINSIAINANDEIFIIGASDSTAYLGGLSFSKGIFGGVFNSSGILTNSFHILTNNSEWYSNSLTITIDKKDNIYLLGTFNDSAIVVGTTTVISSDSYHGSYFFAKLKKDGTEYWAFDMGGEYRRSIGNITPTSNGEIYFTTTETYGDGPLVKLNSNGTEIWSKVFGGHTYGGVVDMKLDKYEDLYMTGILWVYGTFGSCTVTGNQFFLFAAKVDSLGECVWVKTGQANGESSGLNISIKTANALILGWSMENETIQLGPISVQGIYFLSRISSDQILNVATLLNSEMINVFPNPTSGIFTVVFNHQSVNTKICVSDLLGNCVLDNVSIKSNNQEIDLSNQAKGIYFMEIVSDDERAVKKIVVQ